MTPSGKSSVYPFVVRDPHAANITPAAPSAPLSGRRSASLPARRGGVQIASSQSPSARQTASVRAKWVKTWRISPAGRQSAATRGRDRVSVRERIGPPVAGRQRQHAAEEAARRAADQRHPVVARKQIGHTLAFRARRLRGAAWKGCRRTHRPRRQSSAAGQMAQIGARACRPSRPGPSAPAPSRQAARAGTKEPASARSSGFAAGSGVSTAKSRATTRSTLPSTTLVGRSKAIAAIAAAV